MLVLSRKLVYHLKAHSWLSHRVPNLLLAQVNKPSLLVRACCSCRPRSSRAGARRQFWPRLAARRCRLSRASCTTKSLRLRVRLGGSRPLHPHWTEEEKKPLGIFHGHGTKSCCWGVPLSYGVAGRGRGLIEAWNPLDNLWGQLRHLRVRKKQLERYGEPVEEANTIEYEDTMVTPLAGEHEIAAW